MLYPVVLIPAYQPDQTLLEVVEKIKKLTSTNTKIVVVDDGSVGAEATQIFTQLTKIAGTIVLKHPTNKGKGAALKTGFEYCILNYPGAGCIVTADADGQHRACDIVRVVREKLVTEAAVLGVRKFDSKVPLRSRFGNILTQTLFRIFFRSNVTDTQTGLRGLSIGQAASLLNIEANGYDFEFEALIRLAKGTQITQVAIETVYEPGNPTSHFNPVFDSIKIYATFFRHLSATVLIGALDYLMFVTLIIFDLSVFWSLVVTRIISTLLYFFAAKKYIFKSSGRVIIEFFLFTMLVIVNIVLLWPFITLLRDYLSISPSISMVFGYGLLFISNFMWQNFVIFRIKEGQGD
jgi:glycosyltransferase involved in cell wall biosynthesis